MYDVSCHTPYNVLCNVPRPLTIFEVEKVITCSTGSRFTCLPPNSFTSLIFGYLVLFCTIDKFWIVWKTALSDELHPLWWALLCIEMYRLEVLTMGFWRWDYLYSMIFKVLIDYCHARTKLYHCLICIWAWVVLFKYIWRYLGTKLWGSKWIGYRASGL